MIYSTSNGQVTQSTRQPENQSVLTLRDSAGSIRGYEHKRLPS